MSAPVVKVWDAEQSTYVGIPAIKGTDGKTLVRGTDYWTAADKKEIVNDVLAALPDGSEVAY